MHSHRLSIILEKSVTALQRTSSRRVTTTKNVIGMMNHTVLKKNV